MVMLSGRKAEELDPVDLVRKAIAADLDSSVFTEESFDVAKNSLEWCTSHKFLAFDVPLWPRQVQTLARFFEDVCYFCSDADYVHNVPVDDSLQNLYDRFVFLEHGVCPRCRRNRTEMLSEWQCDPRYAKYANWGEGIVPVPKPPNELTCIWGQRSSKSSMTSTFTFTYILHRYLAVPNITNYFQLASNSLLEAVFVAPTKNQIDGNMWTPFKNAFDSSPWFRSVVAHCKSEEKRLGLPMYMRQQTYIGFPHKRLLLFMKAANSGTLRGATRIAALIDEYGWFNTDPESGRQRTGVKDGVEVFTALDRSLLTVRGAADIRRKRYGDYNALDGYMCAISSPSSISDPIEQRAAQAPKLRRAYFTRLPTWEVNPGLSEETVLDFAGGDMVTFHRDYGAKPPRAVSPFIESGTYLKELVDVELTKRPLLTYSIQTHEDKDAGITLLRPVLGRRTPDRTTPRVLTVDNGEKKNSFALCLASYYPEHDGVLLEDFLEVAPYRHHHVDLQWCYDELIVPLLRSFNILNVVYDQWESSYAVRDLRTNYNVDADQYSLKWKDFESFREDLKASRIWFPVPEVEPDDLLLMNNLVERARHPRAHFQVQLTTVNQFTHKVVKPDSGNDDLFRCAVLAHYIIKNNKDKYRRGMRSRTPGQKRSNVFSTAGSRGANRGPSRPSRGGGNIRRGVRY